MSVAGILKVVLFILAGVSLLVAFRMLLTGVRSRNAANRQFFNVGRLEARRKVFSSMLSTIGLVLLALLFLVGALFVPDDFLADWLSLGEEPLDSVAKNGEEADPGVVLETSETNPIVEIEQMTAVPPELTALATLTPVPTETPVPTPARIYVYVDSPIVGLYIRDLPDGDIMDVLDDRTRLSLSGESTIVNGISWILVLTDEEREGWVAEQFTTKIPPVEGDGTPIPDNLDSQDIEEQQDG